MFNLTLVLISKEIKTAIINSVESQSVAALLKHSMKPRCGSDVSRRNERPVSYRTIPFVSWSLFSRFSLMNESVSCSWNKTQTQGPSGDVWTLSTARFRLPADLLQLLLDLPLPDGCVVARNHPGGFSPWRTTINAKAKANVVIAEGYEIKLGREADTTCPFPVRLSK